MAGQPPGDKYGLAGFAQMGRQGGLTTRQRYGREYYHRLGKLGGIRTRNNRAERGLDATEPDE